LAPTTPNEKVPDGSRSKEQKKKERKKAKKRKEKKQQGNHSFQTRPLPSKVQNKR
jgi:hypothetical protein